MCVIVLFVHALLHCYIHLILLVESSWSRPRWPKHV